MAKKKKVFGIFALVIIAAIGIIFYLINREGKVSREDQIKKMLEPDGQSIEIDGYKFTLLETLYDSNTGSGAGHIVVTSEKEDLRELMTESTGEGLYEYFGTNDQYIFFASAAVQNLDFSLKNNKLHIYFDYIDTQLLMKNRIWIVDAQKAKVCDLFDSNKEEVLGEFKLSDTNCAVQIDGREGEEIYISPFVIKVTKNVEEGASEHSYSNLEIVLEDGKKIELTKNGKIQKALSYTGENRGGKSVDVFYHFREIISPEEIDYLIINGEKYSKIEHSVEDDTQATEEDTCDRSEAEELIYKLVELENDAKWDEYPDLWCEQSKNTFKGLFTDEQYVSERRGILTVDSAEISSIEKLPSEDLMYFIGEFVDEYSNIECFLTGIKYTTENVTKSFYNGVNFRLIVVGEENNTKKIIAVMEAPESLLDEGIQTYDKQIAKDIVEARKHGYILDSDMTIVYEYETIQPVS